MEAVSAVSTALSVLIVDDEPGIRKALEGALSDEGFETYSVETSAAALSFLASKQVSLVLLDIWLPGMDGLEALTRIKALYPNLPVIMISGHATIATAVKATQLGASDFIEKPLDLHMTLASIRRALSKGERSEPQSNSDSSEEDLSFRTGSGVRNAIKNIAFKTAWSPGKKVPQRTISKSAVLYGQGLHSGKKSGLMLEPLPPGSGIHFVGVSDTTPVPAHVDYVESTGFATTVKLGSVQAGTIEHLLSALHAYGITNLLIKCNGEVPVMDGSAKEFCALLEDTGIEIQSETVSALKIEEKVRIGTDEEFMEIEPSEDFTIHYILKYPQPVGVQEHTFTLKSPEDFKREIASARTFGFVKDIGYLQKQGLALGGRFDNFVLFGEEGPINCELRFSDEPVRHKILDAIGDLYLLGRPIQGKVTASMTGHSDNIALLKEIVRRWGQN